MLVAPTIAILRRQCAILGALSVMIGGTLPSAAASPAAAPAFDLEGAIAAASTSLDPANDAAGTRLVEALLSAGRPLVALQYSEKWLTGAELVNAEFRITSALYDAGLEVAATELLDRALASRTTLTASDQLTTVDTGVTATIAAGRLDDAVSMLDGQDCVKLEHSCADLVSALAARAHLDQAGDVLARLPSGPARDSASADLAGAFARAQQLHDADGLIASIADPVARGSAQARIVAWLAENGEPALAKSRAATLDLPAGSFEARLIIARAMVSASDPTSGMAMGNDVLSSLAALGDAPAEVLKGELVALFADAGDFDRARGILDAMSEDRVKDEALGLLATAAAKRGDYSLARELLSGVDLAHASAPLAPQLVDAFSAAAHDAPSLRDLVAMIDKTDSDPDRVKLLRAIAQARYNDLSLSHANALPASIDLASAPAMGPLFDNGLYQTYAAPGGIAAPNSLAYPPLVDSVERLRAEAPLPGDSTVFLVPASMSPYNSKFLEDLADAGNGLTPATRAQGSGEAQVIVIHSGVVTLGELIDKLAASNDFDYLKRDGDTITLRAPLLVEPEATLILSGAEASTYRLSATAGSFIAVAGKLFVLDTTVTSWDEETQSPRWLKHETNTHFRPFIVGWSGSHMMLGGSSFLELGYAAPKSFGLSFSTGPKGVLSDNPDLPPPTGIVADNYFENLEYGFYSFEADGVHMVGNEYDENIVYAIDPHDRSKHLLIALNSTHRSQVKHGIIVSREVEQSWIVGNLTYDNAGSGIMLDRSSTNNLVFANSSFANVQDGVTIYESSCNAVQGNWIDGNDRDGVKIRNSWNVSVAANDITANDGVGVNAYVAKIEATSELRDFVMDPYTPFTNFDLDGNSIVNNGGGLRASGVAGFSIFGSNFGPQRHRLTSGDIKGLEGYVLQSSASGAAVVSRACAVDDLRASCALPPDRREIAFGGNGISNCLPWQDKSAGSVPAAEGDTQ